MPCRSRPSPSYARSVLLVRYQLNADVVSIVRQKRGKSFIVVAKAFVNKPNRRHMSETSKLIVKKLLQNGI